MKYFITYGNQVYAKSKLRLKEQAESIGLFDKVIAYGESDLSDEVLRSELMTHKKGGGLWSWKPDVILKAMENAKDGDIIVYADSGCSVFNNCKWKKLFGKLSKHEIIAFHLGVKNREYCKRELIEFFMGNEPGWIDNFQVAGTTIMLRKTPNSESFIREWRSVMIDNPSLVLDVHPGQAESEHPRFKAHRHDQSVFSALIYKYYRTYSIKILQNHFEGRHHSFFNQAIVASRIADASNRSGTEKSLIRSLIHHLLVRPVRTVIFTLRCKIGRRQRCSCRTQPAAAIYSQRPLTATRTTSNSETNSSGVQ